MDQWRNQRNKKIHGDKWDWDTMVQNLWNAAKAILRGKFIVIQAYLKKTRNISNNLALHLKKLEKEQWLKLKKENNKYQSTNK